MIWVTRTLAEAAAARLAAAAPIAAGAALACGMVTGCGGMRRQGSASAAPAVPKGKPSPAAMAVRAAALRTLEVPAGVEFELQGASALGSSSAPVLGSGEFDFPAATGSEAIDLGEVGNREPGNERVVLFGGDAYLQPKARASRVLPRGKQWVLASLAGSDAVSANFPSFVLQLEGLDPRFLLGELATGARSAVEDAPTLVNGIPARPYDVEVDLARALSASHGPLAPVFGQAIRSELTALSTGGVAGGGATSGVATGRRDVAATYGTYGTAMRVWVDRAGRVVRLRATPPGAGVGTATMTFCCLGVPVEVVRPSDASVVDLGSLTPSGERENNGGGDSDGG